MKDRYNSECILGSKKYFYENGDRLNNNEKLYTLTETELR